MNILLHSYTFRDRRLKEACKAAHDLGYNGIELSRVHFDDQQLETQLPAAIKTAQAQGTKILCVDFAADLINNDETLRSQSADLLQKNIQICARHDIKLMNGYIGTLTSGAEDFSQNGSALATDTHYQNAANALRPIADLAASHTLTLTLEIHMNTPHDTIASMTRLLNQTDRPNILATPDPGNMYATSTADRDPQALQTLCNRIGLFHLKNCRIQNGNIDYSVSLKDGDINLPHYLQTLQQLGYTGPLCIEHVGDLDPKEVAKQDINYLKEHQEKAQGL